jgi:hypothetical protein
MKVRKGFVSNSSTSSFLIYGIYDPPRMGSVSEVIEKLSHLLKFSK